MATQTITVSGMTCQHCAASVREELSEIPGLTVLDIDVASGKVTIEGSDFSEDAVAAAVEEAGYQLVK